MPTPNNESLANANFIQSGQPSPLPTHMTGRLTGLPLYELDYHQLVLRVPAIGLIVTYSQAAYSMAHPTCVNRRANHNDALGNLPYGPHPGQALCEYHVPSNGLPFPAHLRLVYDTYRRMLYVTPTHYDPWNDNSGTARNPFYLVVNHPSITFGGIP